MEGRTTVRSSSLNFPWVKIVFKFFPIVKILWWIAHTPSRTHSIFLQALSPLDLETGYSIDRNWVAKLAMTFNLIDTVSIWKYLGLSHFPDYGNGNCQNKSIYLVRSYLSFLLTANKGRLSEGILIFFNGRARYGTVKTSSDAIYCISSSWWTKTVAEVGSAEALIRIFLEVLYPK